MVVGCGADTEDEGSPVPAGGVSGGVAPVIARLYANLLTCVCLTFQAPYEFKKLYTCMVHLLPENSYTYPYLGRLWQSRKELKNHI